MTKRLGLLAAVALALLAVTGTAQASSIVFIRDGDAWLTTPDGTREHRVTSGQDFKAVTQADDGTIFAWRPGLLYKLDQNGNELQRPKQVIDMFDLDASPDGRQLAFWYVLYDGRHFDVLNSDGTHGSWDDNNGSYPQWMDNDGVLRSNDAGYLAVQFPGNGNYYSWTGEPDGKKFSVAITRAKDRLVAAVRDYSETGPWTLVHYSNGSQPPRDDTGHILAPPPNASDRPAPRCTENYGASEPAHPSFSPDGTQMALQVPQGVVVQAVLDLANCTRPNGGFVIPRAISPDWGPADVPAERATGGGRGKRLCKVPKLVGKKLAKAKKMIKSAHCKLGKVTKVGSSKKRGTVVKQSPKAGKLRAAGTKVAVTVAR